MPKFRWHLYMQWMPDVRDRMYISLCCDFFLTNNHR